MKLSACVIVKNEERNLPEWLECMKRIADELVVVDTGSEDRTVALAEEAGARVFHFDWIHDFAAARNFTIEQASGDWILFLDADESFAPEECARVRQILEKYHLRADVAGLMFPLMNVDRAAGQDKGGITHVVRAFRNVEYLRYRGRIHEALTNISHGGNKTIQSIPGPMIYHTGYSADVIQEKIRRNMEILKEDAGGRDIDDYYLMDAYYGLGEYEKAVRHAEKLLAEGIRVIGSENRVHTVRICAMEKLERPAEEIYQALEEAVKQYPQAAEFRMLWGSRDWALGDYAGAEQQYLHASELFREEQEGRQRNILASHSINFLPAVYLHLGEIASWKGKVREAVRYLGEYLKLMPGGWYAAGKLCRELRERPLEEVDAVFESIYKGGRESEHLAALFSLMGMGRLALAHEKRSGRQLFDSFERHLLEGSLSAAAAGLEDSLTGHYESGILMYRQKPSADGVQFLTVLPESWRRRIPESS